MSQGDLQGPGSGGCPVASAGIIGSAAMNRPFTAPHALHYKGPVMTQPELSSQTTRRQFIHSTVAASAVAATGLSLARSAHAAGDDTIKIGVVGCGGRGVGAALNAMDADPSVRLVAMSDLFANRVTGRRAAIQTSKPKQCVVDDDHCFVGLDGYKKVIDAVDVVLIACAAKFHPMYLKAGIEAGKHVFVEKPHAIDPAGIRGRQ